MMNHFALFDLPVAFDVDTEQLAEQYRQLQRTAHPDKFAHASDRDRRLAVQKASQINEAFQVLKDPLSRGRYMLELADALTNDETDTAMDGAFLMQQIELREELAELKDKSDPLAAIADFVSRMEAATANLTTKLSGQLAANELEPARETVRQMQFYKKLREEALLIEEGLLF